MSLRAVIQPVNGTFELRWQWHRGDAPPAGMPEAPGEPKAVSRDGAGRAARSAAEPAMASAGPHLDEAPPAP